ncbi:MAG TPA: hypothetical protein DHV71_02025 [Acidaminococcaceae bacterium]|nr:hypothetical protein [Acidaminococcaceae bacterium]
MVKIKKHYTKVLIFVVCIILGFMISMQLKSTLRSQTVSVQRAEELSVRLQQVENDRDNLARELEEYRTGRVSSTLKQEMDNLNAYAGRTALQGKGIILTIDDSQQTIKAGENKNLYIIHDEDLLRVVNELRAAGAEAIAINDQRVTGTSEIRCVGPTVLVNEIRLAAPFVIKAIGNPQTLESSLKLRGGVLDNFKFWGIKAELAKSDTVKVPPAALRQSFEYAKIVPWDAKKETEGTTETAGKGGAAK